MDPRRTVGALATLTLLAAAPLAAQYRDRESSYDRRDPRVVVSAEISRPPARRVVVERREPRVIVVDRWRGPRAQRRYWARHGYRPIVVYVVAGRYYDRWDDRWDRRRVDVREVTVFERDGRYYRDWDDVRDYDRWRRDYDRDRD